MEYLLRARNTSVCLRWQTDRLGKGIVVFYLLNQLVNQISFSYLNSYKSIKIPPIDKVSSFKGASHSYIHQARSSWLVKLKVAPTFLSDRGTSISVAFSHQTFFLKPEESFDRF